MCCHLRAWHRVKAQDTCQIKCTLRVLGGPEPRVTTNSAAEAASPSLPERERLTRPLL